ncbi:MAG: hypothetical protein AAB473_02215 [Patescibacteria group bacterium]
MKNIRDGVLKAILTLITVMPIAGVLGIFPEPTADLYTSQRSFAFIQAIMDAQYIMVVMAIVFAAVAVLLWTKRVALAALLLLPLTVNIVGFHLFLDGGLFTAGAIMADALLVLNIYFLYQQRARYAGLLEKR